MARQSPSKRTKVRGNSPNALHNAVVAWNTIQIGRIVSELRAEGQQIEDETLSHVTPLLRKAH